MKISIVQNLEIGKYRSFNIMHHTNNAIRLYYKIEISNFLSFTS